MKVSSCTHSFALLALSFFTIQFASSLSLDSKAFANLHPRLDGEATVPDASSSSSPTRRRKKCKFTKSVSGVTLSTGVAVPVVTGSPAPANNVSSLALGNQLSYARSYKTKCSKKTGSVYLPSASSSPESGSGSGSSSGSDSSHTGSSGSGSGSGSDSSSGTGSNSGSSNPAENANAGSPATGNNNPGSSPAGSGQPAGSAGVCGPQQTVTITSQTTVTVTQVAQAADSASAHGATADSESAASAGPKGSPNVSSVDGSHGGQAAASSGLGALMENASSASASSTAVVGGSSSDSPSSVSSSPGSSSSGSSGSDNAGSGNSGFGNVGSGNMGSGNTGNGNSGSGNTGNGNSGSGNSGSGNSGNGNTGSGNSGSGNLGSGNSGSGNSGSGNSGSGNSGSGDSGNGNSGSGDTASGTSASGVSDHGPYYSNATVSGSASPSGTGSSLVPMHVNNSTSGFKYTKRTSNANPNGQFWAGATIGTLMRMEAIPQRVFYDYDGKTVKDPIKTLADAGVNAMRVEATRGQCLGPTNFVNNASTLGDELLFQLDWGCIDSQVKTAQRSVAQGMRVVLTINQGFDIPAGMESYNYEQMVGEVQKETKRQLQPFLDANIVPDVILFENEGSDGFLFNEIASSHIRGNNDGKVPVAQVDKEKCGTIPTGNMNSFPQYAGYLKAEVITCNDAIAAAGFSTAAVRYGLHSHGQYVQWKEGVVHGPNAADQTNLIDTSGKSCSNAVIPQNLLSQNVSEMLTIMGFSAYPDPMTPLDINSNSSERDTFNRTLTTLTQMMGYAEAYGKYESGPFAGEYKLQALGVEYGTSFTYDQIPQEQQETATMWSLVKQFPNVLGMMWYEAWYCHADWEGGKAALCHNVGTGDISGQAPTDTLKTWGSAAQSPWRK